MKYRKKNRNEKTIRVAILTISDSASGEKRRDESGPLIIQRVKDAGWKAEYYEIIPDEKKIIIDKLRKLSDGLGADLVFTTGGTGFSPRDVTPEATRAVIQKEAPGIAEAMRLGSLRFTSRAMLSRGKAGIRGKTLIINLPGSPAAVRECLGIIFPVLPHAIEILSGRKVKCARKHNQ